jgi:acetyl-CoA carboxylase carboxyltransferase component
LSAARGPGTPPPTGGPPLQPVSAPVAGRLQQWLAAPGTVLAAGEVVALLESMKMEVPVTAPVAGVLHAHEVAEGKAVEVGDVLGWCRAQAPASGQAAQAVQAVQATHAAHAVAGPQAGAPAGPTREAVPTVAPVAAVRPDLQALLARRALLDDAARPQAMAQRHATGLRSARENVADLLDPGSFNEYGAFAVAAQRKRRTEAELQRETPADGLITGTGTVAGRPCAVVAYDYTVLAGTQGVWNHAKADRLLELVARERLPLVLFAEGGGGRPGDVDWHGVAGLDCTTFARLAALSGEVPLVGIAAGRCFAGNAALLGCCDLVVAVEGASIGLGGPAMIEGGGLGRVAAEEVGPVDVLARAGVVDVRVASEAEAVQVARDWLGRTAGPGAPGGRLAQSEPGGDLTSLRESVPASRRAVYEPLAILRTLADAGSLLELRADFAPGLVTAAARLEGRPVMMVASRPQHLGGALDGPASDKLAHAMQRADALGWPLLTFVDTPGFMVGPASEATGMVRRAARVFVTAAALRVPVLSVMLRRGYGLGAMALAAGHFHAPVATCAWPGGEFGPMGIEGAVRLGFRRELQAGLGAAREALFEQLVEQSLERGRALNLASHLEIDDVIDPAETRAWLLRHLRVLDGRPLGPRRSFLSPC